MSECLQSRTMPPIPAHLCAKISFGLIEPEPDHPPSRALVRGRASSEPSRLDFARDLRSHIFSTHADIHQVQQG